MTSTLPDRGLVAVASPGEDTTALTARPCSAGAGPTEYTLRTRPVPDSSLTASRARIAGFSDEDRRRLQHDLHHGAQQRLVHAIMACGSPATASPQDGPRST